MLLGARGWRAARGLRLFVGIEVQLYGGGEGGEGGIAGEERVRERVGPRIGRAGWAKEPTGDDGARVGNNDVTILGALGGGHATDVVVKGGARGPVWRRLLADARRQGHAQTCLRER